MEYKTNEQSTSEAPIDTEKTSRPFFGYKAESPESKEENAETEEECSVCRNEMIDTTALSDCVHEFCYDCIVGWLTKGSGQFCPMCKTPVKYIRRKATEEKVTIEEIVANKEPEAVAAENLITEKRIVSRKMRGCRRMNSKIDEIIGATSATRHPARHEELNSLKQMSVAQLNSLQMLRDDIDHGAAKALVVSKLAFRRLVYEREVVAEGLPDEYAHVTKQEFLNNIEHYRVVMKTFLVTELKAIPVKSQPRVDNNRSWIFFTLHDKLEGKDEEVINQIFDIIPTRGSLEYSSKHVETLFQGLVSMRTIFIFLAELQSLINSKMTYLEWCGAVRYRFETDRGGEAIEHDVVTVDDTVDEPDVEEPPPRELYDRTRPVFNPYNQIFGGPRNSVSSSYERARRASSSDTDQDDDIYFQTPLLISQNNPYHARFSAKPQALSSTAIPKNGISWAELASGPSIFSASKVSSRPTRADSDDDIQVLDADGTIVLDDSTGDPPAVSQADRKRKSTDPVLETRKKTRRTDLPCGLIDDVEKLMYKHGLSKKNLLNTLVAAAGELLDRKTSPPESARRITQYPHEEESRSHEQ